jgi:iron complex transport system ATP-binding protein
LQRIERRSTATGHDSPGPAQTPDILLLDESTSALDISYQLDVMETLHTLVRTTQIAAIMAMHDLNMASRYADAS